MVLGDLRDLQKADHEGVNITWVSADGADFALDGRFRLIIMAFNSLQFFMDATALAALFRQVRQHLDEQGRFVFDVFNPQPAYLAADPATRTEVYCTGRPKYARKSSLKPHFKLLYTLSMEEVELPVLEHRHLPEKLKIGCFLLI